MTPYKQRVLLVEDHPVTLRGLRAILGRQSWMTICGEAADSREAVVAVDEDPPPDLVVMDLFLHEEDGIALIKQLRRQRPGLRILVCSYRDEREHAPRALKAGALGFIHKEAREQEFRRALREVCEGRRYLSPAMRILMGEGPLPVPAESFGKCAKLSPREYYVFCLIGVGLGTRQIAEKMGVSIKTVETHKMHIKEKLGLADAEELEREAVRNRQAM